MIGHGDDLADERVLIDWVEIRVEVVINIQVQTVEGKCMAFQNPLYQFAQQSLEFLICGMKISIYQDRLI